MSRVVVLGAGIAGHTPATVARKCLGKGHSVAVVSLKLDYHWIPSNVWVGVGLMSPAKVTLPLAPVDDRHGVEFVQAAASTIRHDGDPDDPTPFVVAEAADGRSLRVAYD